MQSAILRLKGPLLGGRAVLTTNTPFWQDARGIGGSRRVGSHLDESTFVVRFNRAGSRGYRRIGVARHVLHRADLLERGWHRAVRRDLRQWQLGLRRRRESLGQPDVGKRGARPGEDVRLPANLPTCKTSKRRMLIATEGFAALGLVTPDYVIPNGFLQIPNGDLYFAGVSPVDIHRASDRRRQRLLPGRNGAAKTWPPIFAGVLGVGDSPGRAGDGQRGRISPCGVRSLFHHAGRSGKGAARRPRAAVPGLVADWVLVQRLRERRRAGGLGRHLPLLQRSLRHRRARISTRPTASAAKRRSPSSRIGDWKTTSSSTRCCRTHRRLSGRDYSGLSHVQPGHGRRAEPPLRDQPGRTAEDARSGICG